MSIAPRRGIPRGTHVLPTGTAMSRLDRALAPLADLGRAIRDEIAASLAPMAQELETACERAAALEARVGDLESRLAAAAVALLGTPFPATRPVVEQEPASAPERTEAIAAIHPIVDGEVADRSPRHPQSVTTTETQGGVAAGPETACLGPQPNDPVPSSNTMGMQAEAPTREKKPRDGAVRKGAAAAPVPALTITLVFVPGVSATAVPVSMERVPATQMDAATVPVAVATMAAAPMANTPDASASESCRGASAADELPEQLPVADESADPTSAASGPSGPATIPVGDGREGLRSDGPAAMARDPAAGLLHPLLEHGAREMIALGLFPDLTALLNGAVYRLLESDYPATRADRVADPVSRLPWEGDDGWRCRRRKPASPRRVPANLAREVGPP